MELEECQLQGAQARREAGWMYKGLRRARERLVRRLERLQPAARAQQDLGIAKLGSSALSKGGTPPLFQTTSDNSKPRQAGTSPFTPKPAEPGQLPLESTPGVAPHTPLLRVVQRVVPVSTAPPSGRQPNLTPTNPTAALQGQAASALGPLLPSGPAPANAAPVCWPTAIPLRLQSSAVYQPTGSNGRAAREVPRLSLPVFESGLESELARLQLALDNLLGDEFCLSEQYKYQVLLGQIKLPEALQLAKVYMHDSAPYSSALHALKRRYVRPRQLVQAMLDAPALPMGDTGAFCSFACLVQSLVGALETLEGQNGRELRCSSHVDCLLSKMPPAYRVGFIENCLRVGVLRAGADRTYTLPDLAAWLQTKSEAEQISSQVAALYRAHTRWEPSANDRPEEALTDRARVEAKPRAKPYGLYCNRCEAEGLAVTCTSLFCTSRSKKTRQKVYRP